MDRKERLGTVNEIIGKIASTGRKFFCSKEDSNTGYFFFNKNGRLYWWDEHSRKPIYACQPISKIKYFSHGGTLKHLIFNEFREYIMWGGTPLPLRYSGLAGWHWGYAEEDLTTIANAAKELGYLGDLSKTA